MSTTAQKQQQLAAATVSDEAAAVVPAGATAAAVASAVQVTLELVPLPLKKAEKSLGAPQRTSTRASKENN